MKKIAAMAARGPRIMGRNGMLSWLHSKTLLSPSSVRLDGLVCFPLAWRGVWKFMTSGWRSENGWRTRERFNNENEETEVSPRAETSIWFIKKIIKRHYDIRDRHKEILLLTRCLVSISSGALVLYPEYHNFSYLYWKATPGIGNCRFPSIPLCELMGGCPCDLVMSLNSVIWMAMHSILRCYFQTVTRMG